MNLTVIEGGEDRKARTVREAAEKLAQARVDFAEAFIRAKTSWRGQRPLTDREAHEMTVHATKDEITILQAELDIALHEMRST